MSDGKEIHTKDSALLMLKIRNLVWEETGTRLRLSEEGAVERFIDICARSENPDLQRCGEELRILVGATSVEPEQKEKQGTRRYRGAVMPDQHKEPELPPELIHQGQTGAPRKGKVVTYRGQKIIV